MRYLNLRAGVSVLLFCTACLATATHGMVASGHPEATTAGLDVLKAGGNAIDAAVATGLALGVVDGHNSGIGGGCFLLIRLANGRIVAVDGRETAPARARPDMFVRDGKADPRLSQTGALASGVPGEVAAFEYVSRHYGRKTWKSLLAPSIALAEQGYPLTAGQARRIAAVAEDMAGFASTRRVFFKGDRPLQAGDALVQTDLAKTYRQLAEHGAAWFYRGDFARAAARWMDENGGIMDYHDFAGYEIKLREPVQTKYHGYRVVSFPPPSSGGPHVIQMLNLLERFDIKRLDEVTRWHLLAETMKLAFADRAYWLGDPDYARVPRGLLDKSYARELGRGIDLGRAGTVTGHGTPPAWEDSVFGKHTTHFSVADAEGNWVAVTATINTTYGSKVVIPGTGVVMNNQMDDFSAQPGARNYFGLVGSEANSVQPGKRPLSSMSPTLVFKGRQPIIALGAAGGPKIISTVLTELVLMLDLGFSAAEAVAAPRIHHQWSPDELVVESALPEVMRRGLAARGHKLRVVEGGISVSQIVARDPRTGELTGAADPRGSGSARAD